MMTPTDGCRATAWPANIGAVGENVFEERATGGGPDLEWEQSAMEPWLQSPGHRANILRSSFTQLGVCATQHESVLAAAQVLTVIWAYFERPLPWLLSVGDSFSVAIQSKRAIEPLDEYTFLPIGEPPKRSFREFG